MKQSVFRDNNAEKLIDRINRLSVSSIPLWGKMNVSQMLAHCNVTFNSALGKIPIEDHSNFIFRTIIKWVALSEQPFRKNLPTSKEFRIADKREFEAEKKKLVDNIRQVTSEFVHGGFRPHPAFGKLTNDEWGWLFFKHTDHHLKQFGV